MSIAEMQLRNNEADSLTRSACSSGLCIFKITWHDRSLYIGLYWLMILFWTLTVNDTTFQLQKSFSLNSSQAMYHTTHWKIGLPAIFASSLLTCSPFFASKLRISSLDDRALTYSNKNGKEKCFEYTILKYFSCPHGSENWIQFQENETSEINLLSNKRKPGNATTQQVLANITLHSKYN